MSGTSSNAKNSRRQRTNGIKDKTGDWLGFVDITLDDGDRAIIEDALATRVFDTGQFLLEVLEEGYKLSLSPDELHACVIATITGRSPHCPNVGYSLTARGPDIMGALCALEHKHVAICKRGTWLTKATPDQRQLKLFD